MNQLNNLLIEGTVIDTPEIIARGKESGANLVKFTIANDRYYKDINGKSKQDTLFLVCQCWGDLGEKILKRIEKGMLVRAVGRLKMERWKTKTGENRSTVELVCSHIEYRAEKAKHLAVIEKEDDDHDDYSTFDEEPSRVD